MSRVLPAARTVVVFGLVLQAAGFVKVLVVANFFGTGALLDAYYLALIIPTFAAGVAAGMMQTSFIASYVTAKSRGAIEAAHRLAGFALTWSVLALALVALLSMLGRDAAMGLVALGAKTETRLQLQQVFVPLVWTAPLLGLADCGAMLLNAEGRFSLAACAPLLNAAVGTLVLALWRDSGAAALVWSLVAGLIAQAAMVLLAIRGARVPLRPVLSLPAALPGVFAAVALPVLISTILGNVVLSILQMISARAGVGAVSSMAYASRLHNALIQAVVLSASVVLLPHFARLNAEGRTVELRENLERVFAAALLFSIGSVALVAVGGPRLVAILLQRGSFTAADADLVSAVWLALTTGLLGATWSIFLARLFQAQHRAWVIAGMTGVSVVLNVLLALALRPPLGVIGVALANSLAYLVVMGLYHWRARHTLGPILSRVTLVFAAKVLAGNLAAYWVASAAPGWLYPIAPGWLMCLQVAAVVIVNVLLARGAPLRLTPRAVLQL
ncbi:MAG: polysaccharide biosynthesis C-terminal domain-containing protein [Proteobacteria bacterium]|nr:polysaccharide biosynthesis C-terminal domain-containing protein [Pseudomonadota bacterium]